MTAFTCRDLVESATAYHEGALPEAERVRLVQHLDGCDDCVLYLNQLTAVIRSVSALPAPEVPTTSRAKLVARFRERRDRR
jgi:anti-sigma factor RsiW